MFYNEFLVITNTVVHIRFTGNFVVEKISQLLQDKGMNPEAAIVRAKAVFGEESEKATLYLHNLQGFLDGDIMKKVYAYLAQKALFQEPVQFSSYDHMLRMIQQVYKTSLNEEELKQIKQIAQANHYAIALVR